MALDVDITLEEVQAAIARLQRGKAMGIDDIPNEVFISAGSEFTKLVWAVLSLIWNSEEIPSDWKVGLVSPQFKTGDRQDVNDYRGITLLCTMGKVYGSILDARLKAFCESPHPSLPDQPRLADEQGGFRPSRGCPEQIFALTETIRKRKRANLKTFCCFIDISKAYDRVFRDGLWQCLWDFGVKGKLWRVLKEMLQGSESSMVINGARLSQFGIEVGVRQGCVLSPTLFSIFFDGLVRRISACDRGARFSELNGPAHLGERLHSLFFADDIVLLAESAHDLSAMLEAVESYSVKWRFDLSKKKTEVVVFNGNAEDEEDASEWCTLDGVSLKVSESYKYLGMDVEEEGRAWAKFKTRMLDKAEKVMRATWGLGLQNGHMAKRGAARLWTAFVRPILEYGS